MKTRAIIAVVVGIITLMVVGFAIYKVFAGKDVGFTEVMTIGTLLISFFLLSLGGQRKRRMEYCKKKSLDKESLKKAQK